MPAALILRFHAPPNGPCLAEVGGHRLHGGFLAMVGAMDPCLAEELHTPGRHKPFTLAPIRDRRNGGSAAPALGGLRVTCLDDELTRRLQTLATLRPCLRIGTAQLEFADMITSGGHLAGSASYDDLLASPGHKRGGPASLELFFDTPTAFRSGRSNLLFPLPSLVFPGLRDKWNMYSGRPWPVFPAERFDSLLTPCRYSLQTRILSFHSYRQIGFCGTCRYRLAPGLDPELENMLLCLTRFAFYAGIGYKTTMGMGMARGRLLQHH